MAAGNRQRTLTAYFADRVLEPLSRKREAGQNSSFGNRFFILFHSFSIGPKSKKSQDFTPPFAPGT
ncbi:MAG: hypothetical protein LBP88_07475 [Treponema sp.]|nr:hypothetical protein [Treponema sp.]